MITLSGALAQRGISEIALKSPLRVAGFASPVRRVCSVPKPQGSRRPSRFSGPRAGLPERPQQTGLRPLRLAPQGSLIGHVRSFVEANA